MNFFMIIGPQAVGKMTVGQALAKKIGARLFYNHMTIDLVENFFDYGTPQGNRLVKEYRNLLFNEVINAPNYPGFIFTYVCDFESRDGLSSVYETCNLFENGNCTSYIIELNADYKIRKERNATANRMAFKKAKRNITYSCEIFEQLEKRTRTCSYEGEINWPRYLRIDNTNIEPETAADIIIEQFHLLK